MSENLNSLIPMIYEVVEDPDKWYEVLAAICNVTGASKAIMSLRDRMTAELVIPTGVENSFNSPMLYNFDEAHVQSFVETYAQFDPWTPIEKLCHPNRPYALSDYLPHKDLEASKFWEWLEPQGIGDTVVAEIGVTATEWIALNMYFPHDAPKVRDNVLYVLNELLPLLKKVWRVGEIVRDRHLEKDRFLHFLESYREGAILIRRDATLVAANSKAQQLTDCPIGFSGQKLLFKTKKVRDKFNAELARLGDKSSQIQSIDFVIGDYAFSLSLMGPAEDNLGMDKATRLLTVNRSDDSTALLKRPVWELAALTQQERELVRHLALGGTLNNFGEKSGLSIHGTDSRWRNVKRKLNVEHPREICAIHRIFQAQNHV